MSAQAPCSSPACKVCSPGEVRYFVRVFGPHIDGPFGNSESLVVASPADVKTDDYGSLVVLMAAQQFRPGTPQRPSRRPIGPRTAIYPRGEWTKVVIGKIEPRTQEV